LLEAQLSDGRDYLLGSEAGWVDILGYFPVWMVRANVPDGADLLSGFRRLAAWEQRLASWGHGSRTEMAAEEALQVAMQSHSEAQARVDADDPLALAAGQLVRVSPDDYGIVPVTGWLLRLTADEISIRRNDARAGTVAVHFPRSGYRVEAV
jgi:glutathione S-transferase